MKQKKYILYVSSLCSSRVLNYVLKTSNIKPGQAIQKFHRLLVEGFGINSSACIIETLSSIPVVYSSHNKIFWNLKTELDKKIVYKYIPIINLPVLKNLIVSIYTFFFILIWNITKAGKEKIIICDALMLTTSTSAVFACKITGVKIIAIVTDLPGLLVQNRLLKKKHITKVYNFLCTFLLTKFDGYILLTNQMNEIINPKNRPYLVMEGLVGFEMENSINALEKKEKERIVIYAGAIYEKYGIKNLILAFAKLKGEDLRLYLYGSGDMENDMVEYMKVDNRIIYKGVVNNQSVVKDLMTATLLINPRPTDEEFTKYSFPSKNMEYMVSGTPLLTTQLPGMPKEYRRFVYIIDDETIEGIYQKLQFLLSKPKKELYEFGMEAKSFVLREKSNVKQADRILTFIDNCFCQD